MIRTPHALMLVIALTCSATLSAQRAKPAELVGTEAKTFETKECVNMPEAVSMEQCAGEVVLIKFWGVK
ncbi:hypothetical protein OAU50_00270 [Planctomycetota bacterium]|nr:hypothetical protein [Planctomycetota bacterium]